MTKQTQIDRWFYDKPDLVPDKNGNTVLIIKKSFGPLEVFEWGIDADNNAYALYKWLENDFYANESYCINIGWESLLEQICLVIGLFRGNGLPDWVDCYENILEKLRLIGADTGIDQ